MRKNFFIASVLCLTFSVQSSIYDLQIEKLSGGTVSMSSFTNKKIIITAFNASSPDVGWLRYLDSLQNSDTSFHLIAVPAKDMGGAGNNGSLSQLNNSFTPKFLMTKQAFVKKESAGNQQALFKWLTYVNENAHFDINADAPGQVFIVSKAGILYSVLPRDVPKDILLQVLSQTVIQ
jgi:glutathione peroxidase-family protein